MNIVLSVGAVFGLISILVGAYVSHGNLTLTEREIQGLHTAIEYLRSHALVIVAIGLVLWLNISRLVRSRLQLSAWLFVIGVFVFSGSLMLTYLGPWAGWQALAPTGGVTLMLAWLTLLWAAMAAKSCQ